VSTERDDLIDFVLGELDPARAEEFRGREAEVEVYRRAADVLRAAAAEGWEAAPAREGRLRRLRPLLAVAALLLVAVALFWGNGAPPRSRVFEPDGAFGSLLPEETDEAGYVLAPAEGDGWTVRAGTVEAAALGGDRSWTLGPGDAIRAESEVRTGGAGGARIDLPRGGILYLAPGAVAQIRRRDDGRAAVRVVEGDVCTVAEGSPVHVAVEATDLLLTQESGAALVRRTQPEAICLRGTLLLNRERGESFRVPAGERLPAACADEPRTVPTSEEELNLAWYRDLAYREWTWRELSWTGEALRCDVEALPETRLYLRVLPAEACDLTVRFGGEAREFKLYGRQQFELRLRLSDLGPGPRLEVTPGDAIREARTFRAR
jgi:hypothetical protein